jgi:hypothetical protein
MDNTDVLGGVEGDMSATDDAVERNGIEDHCDSDIFGKSASSEYEHEADGESLDSNYMYLQLH